MTDALAALRLHVFERAHVVQAVGELDQQHAHVGRNGDQQFAEVFCLLGLLGHQIQAPDLGQAINERADFGAKQLINFTACGVGVLDHIVQQRRRNGGVVEFKVGEDSRHFERVRKIGITRFAHLTAMRLHGVNVGAVEQCLIGTRVIFLNPLNEFVLTHHGPPYSFGGHCLVPASPSKTNVGPASGLCI